ncbi:hypothetical protein BJX76DRAFT_361471 [Aspergillus varians]
MAEKANYVPEPLAAGPPGYENPPNAHQPMYPPNNQIPEIQIQTPQPQGPHMVPPQQYAPAVQPSQYPTAVPLHALARVSQVVDCPECHQREMTMVEAVNGKTTQYVHFTITFQQDPLN